MAVFIEKAIEFRNSNTHTKEWPIFLAGDYNSECFDSPYVCATRKPVQLGEQTLEILKTSMAHHFGKIDSEEAIEETVVNGTSVLEDATADDKRVLALIGHFNRTKYEAISLYGAKYSLVHASNIHPKSRPGFGEPNFSNWAHAWKGLLDYIFVLNCMDNKDKDHDEIIDGVKLLQLLRMPQPSEMGPGQPRIGEYPSDHLCLLATINIR